MSISRRTFLRRTGLGGVGLLTFTVAGCKQEMTAADARKSNVPYQVLSPADAEALETVGNALLPGCIDDGLAHYIDHQLNVPAHDCMLMIKYLGVPAPFADFYKAGLAEASKAAISKFSLPISELDHSQASLLVSQIATGSIDDWETPPSAFFYFVLRSDAVDVSYGTKPGFSSLGIPYAAHIDPPSSWGE